MLAVIAIILGIISLIIDAIVKYWYLVVAYILILCLPTIIRHIRNNLEKRSAEEASHNYNFNTQNAESADTKQILHQDRFDSTIKDTHLSSITTEEHSVCIENKPDIVKIHKEAKTLTAPAKDIIFDTINKKFLFIRSIPVYCSKQQEYETGYIIDINPYSEVVTIKFPSSEHKFCISYIGKTIFAVSGQEDTNKIRDVINSMPKKALALSQNVSGPNHNCDFHSRYHSKWETTPVYRPDKPSAHFYYVGKVPLFSEEWISRRVSVERTKSRGKVLYETNGVLSLQHSGASYQAIVRGSSGFNYTCGFKISSEGRIDTWYCNCPAFSKYPKACKHLVATFYAAGEEE